MAKYNLSPCVVAQAVDWLLTAAGLRTVGFSWCSPNSRLQPILAAIPDIDGYKRDHANRAEFEWNVTHTVSVRTYKDFNCRDYRGQGSARPHP